MPAIATAPTNFFSDPCIKLNHSHRFPITLHYPLKFRQNCYKNGFPSFAVFADMNNKTPFFVKMYNKENPVEILDKKLETRENPVDILAKNVLEAIKALQKPVAAAVLVGLLLVCDPNSAFAASTSGRMGGSSFSSSRSSSSSSRSYSGSSSYSSGLSSYNVGRGSGVSYSASYYESNSVLGLAVIAFFLFVIFSDFSSNSVLEATDKTTVLKLQVGLLGLGRSLQKDLNRIAETADTSTPKGLHYVLTETSLALLRHPDYCISGYSSVDVKRSMDEGEKRFNQLSIEERGKFNEETLVNMNNIKKQSSPKLKASGLSNEYIVVTVLVAASGVHKLPSINSSKDLKEALQKLGSIPSNSTLAVEVLWTPQNEDDTLTERELLEDYPLLRPL